jgi:hypothetical protein
MRSYTRARLLGATALAVAVLVAMAPVAGADTAPPKVQVTVTDDFSNGIRFVVAGSQRWWSRTPTRSSW